MYDQIVVPTDGSVGTAHVAMQAIDLANRYDAVLSVVHVVEESGLAPNAGSASDERMEEARRAVERVASIASVHGVDATTEILTGDPADEILAYCEEHDADLVVAGTHGRSGLSRRVVGSVAERLVRHATCPVMTVRLPESDVTVSDEATAREIVADRLAERGDDVEITAVERQVNVWVAEASMGDQPLVVYLDPVSQRTSVVEHE